MRSVARLLLLFFAFTVPWEYSLDLGEPWGNIARIAGFLLLLAAVPAVLEGGKVRVPGPMQWLVLGLFLWFCCSCLWSIDRAASLVRIRAYFQEMMVVWLVWEFAETPAHLRALLRAFVAGSWVLALLSIAALWTLGTSSAEQIRFVAEGQDPNDVARFLDLGLPLAALLLDTEARWPGRLLAAGYLPLGLLAALLTASRGGFLAAVVAVAGCGLLLTRGHARRAAAAAFLLPALAGTFWFVIPRETLARLATIPEQLRGGDLNQRWNIWESGWHAFVQAPLAGKGAGTFVAASGLAPIDTAHNTVLSIAVGGGLCALFLAAAIVAAAANSIAKTAGPLRLALSTALIVWTITSLVDTVEESRATWLLMALIAVAGRVATENSQRLANSFLSVVRPVSADRLREGAPEPVES